MDAKYWVNQSALVKNLFFEYLYSDDFYKKKFITDVDGFLENIQKELATSKIGLIRLSIPEPSRKRWTRFLETWEYGVNLSKIEHSGKENVHNDL